MKKRIGIIGSANCIHLQRYLQTIDPSVYEVTLISGEAAAPLPTVKKVFFVDPHQFHFLKTIRRLWAYFIFMRRQHFHVLQCFGTLSPISWLGGLSSSSILTASVIGVDVFLEEQLQMPWPCKASIINLLRMSDRVFFLSSAMKKKLTQCIKIPANRLQEDFLPVDLKWKNHPVQNLTEDREGGYPVVFSPRMLAPLYRQYELIQAIGSLKNRYPNIHLIQTGYYQNLEYKEKCQRLVAELRLSENVIFLDPLDKEEDLIGIYDRSDLIVMIPVSDGMPSSLIEAWWRKRPVIVSDIYNYDTSWNGKFFIKTPVEIDALSDCITDILRSDNLREHLINNAFDFVSRKSSEVGKRFEDIKPKRKFFRKIYGIFLFLLFLLEPHFSRLRKT